MSTSPKRQAQIVRDTVMHEIAHHFGISDARLAELGRGDAD
jgi:predicted Zn-dependent protease with MMP-like domain